MRFDQNLGNKIRLAVRHNWHDSYNSGIGGDHSRRESISRA